MAISPYELDQYLRELQGTPGGFAPPPYMAAQDPMLSGIQSSPMYGYQPPQGPQETLGAQQSPELEDQLRMLMQQYLQPQEPIALDDELRKKIAYESLFALGAAMLASGTDNFAQALGQGGQAFLGTMQGRRGQELDRLRTERTSQESRTGQAVNIASLLSGREFQASEGEKQRDFEAGMQDEVLSARAKEGELERGARLDEIGARGAEERRTENLRASNRLELLGEEARLGYKWKTQFERFLEEQKLDQAENLKIGIVRSGLLPEGLIDEDTPAVAVPVIMDGWLENKRIEEQGNYFKRKPMVDRDEIEAALATLLPGISPIELKTFTSQDIEANLAKQGYAPEDLATLNRMHLPEILYRRIIEMFYGGKDPYGDVSDAISTGPPADGS